MSAGPIIRDPQRSAGSRGGGATVIAVLASLALLVSGCTGDGDEGGSGNGVPPSNQVATETSIGLVRGRLPQRSRPRVKKRVTAVFDDWVDAAYAGDYPRSDFSDGFPGFSRGARRQAMRDGALMSNAQIGDRLDEVRFTKRRVRVDVLAVDRRAVGVTARFLLALDLYGEVERSERIKGNLYLTYRQGGWQVFGYDVKRGTR